MTPLLSFSRLFLWLMQWTFLNNKTKKYYITFYNFHRTLWKSKNDIFWLEFPFAKYFFLSQENYGNLRKTVQYHYYFKELGHKGVKLNSMGSAAQKIIIRNGNSLQKWSLSQNTKKWFGPTADFSTTHNNVNLNFKRLYMEIFKIDWCNIAIHVNNWYWQFQSGRK